MNLYGLFLKHVSLPLYALRHNDDTIARIREFERTQWLSADELHQIQINKLQSVVHQAFHHTKYYRELSAKTGIAAEDIRNFDDFRELPVLPKEVLQDRLDDLLADNIPEQDTYRGVTSGSSGRPTFYYHQISASNIRHAAGQRLMQMAGYDFGKRIFLIWRAVTDSLEKPTDSAEKKPARKQPLPIRIKKALYDKFAQDNPQVRFDPSLLDSEKLSEMYAELKTFRPHLIISYVSSLYQLAQYIDALGGTDVRPGAIVVSSETLFPYQRELMEKVFKCKVFNRYGLQETGMVAIECPIGDGMHINQEILHLDYQPTVNDDSQIIVTDLINHAMPLLRYETGDRGSPIVERCPCGRGLARIKEIEGRIIELLPTADGKLINGQLFATFHSIEGIRQYQLIQKSTTQILIRVSTNSQFRESNLRPMIDTIYKAFGTATQVDIEYVDAIPFTKGGKYKLVVSEVSAK